MLCLAAPRPPRHSSTVKCTMKSTCVIMAGDITHTHSSSTLFELEFITKITVRLIEQSFALCWDHNNSNYIFLFSFCTIKKRDITKYDLLQHSKCQQIWTAPARPVKLYYYVALCKTCVTRSLTEFRESPAMGWGGGGTRALQCCCSCAGPINTLLTTV